MSDASPSPAPDPKVADMQGRLDSLDDELARAEADADKALPHVDGPTFISPGTIGDEPADDAIVPPG